MSKSSPPAPDYRGAAEEQGAASKENTQIQTYANHPDASGPLGSSKWTTASVIDPATGKPVTQWSQNTTLDPDAQAALKAQLALTKGRSQEGASLMGRVNNEFNTPMDWSHFSPAGTSVNGSQPYYQKAGDAVMNQFDTRMNPQFAKDTAALDTQLRNNGLKPGDQAYDEQIKQLRTSQADARQTAMNQATTMSGTEASRMQGMDVNSGNYNTSLRQQQIAEAMSKRGFSLNEINALISGQQVAMPNGPNSSAAGRADAANTMGAMQNQYQSAMNDANAQNQQTAGYAATAAAIIAAML